MKVFKPLNLSFLYKVFEANRSFRFCGAVICMFPFERTNRLFADPRIWKFAGQELGKGQPLDWVMPKPVGEVLVTGQCFADREQATAGQVHLRIGPVDKALYVFGDRHWVKMGNLGLNISKPEPFNRLPITYDRAFGGPGYDRNPLGKGFCPVHDDQGGESHPLPNIELPKHLIGSPDDRPGPAGFGPLDMTWPQRMSKAGTYDRKWQKDLFPGLAADIDMHFFNLAPDDQWLDGFFQGDEPFAVEGMHPTKDVLVSRLPGFRTRLFIARRTDGQKVFEEIETSLDTVWLFPHAERGILIFHGVTEIGSDDARDVSHCLAAYERVKDEPRPMDHYQEALARRLDKEKRSYYDLYDQDLIPPGETSGWADLLKFDPDKMGPLVDNMTRRAENEKQKALEKRAEAEASVKKMLAAAGLDPSTVRFPPLETPETENAARDIKTFDPEQIARKVKEAEAKANASRDRAIKEARKKEQEAQARIRQACEKQGLNYEEVMAQARAQAPKRPIRYAADLRSRIRNTRNLMDQQVQKAAALSGLTPELLLEQTRAANGGTASPVAAALERVQALDPDDPELVEKLGQLEQLTRESYREHAHLHPRPAPLSPEEVEELIKRFETMRESGASFKDADLAGIDLSGRDLSGIDLAGAFLEGANLKGALLSGADLTGAVLAHADLTGVRADQVILNKANLGRTVLRRAAILQSDLRGAVLSEADLTRARFIACRLDEMQFIETTFRQTDFSRSSLKKALFIKPVMEGASFKGANLVKTTMIEARMTGVDFTDARAGSSSWIGLKARDAIFDRADLTKAGLIKKAQLAGARFHQAVLDNANFMGANLEGASLARASLAKTNMMQANLKKADLAAIVARGAIFTRADLEGATLVGADLMEANLRGARVVEADLRRANLYSAEVFRAVFGETNLEGANLKMTKIRNLEQ